MGNNWELTERQRVIDTYLKGVVGLYGVTTHRQFLKIFNKYNEGKLLKAELLKYNTKLKKHSFDWYCIYYDAIISTKVPSDRIAEIMHYQEGKEFYMPTKDEVLNSAKPDYYEKTPQVIRFTDYLLKKLKFNPLKIDSFLRELIWMIVTEDRMDKLYKMFEINQVRFNNFDQANEVMGLFADLCNNTRKWANCGFTPQELWERSGGKTGDMEVNIDII